MKPRRFERTVAIEEWECDDVPSPLGRISIAGWATHRGIAPDAMRVLGCYVLIYLLEGEGTFQDANRNRATVKPGDCMLLFPGVGHSYGPPANGLWRELFVHFEGPLFQTLQVTGVLDPRRPIHNGAPVDVWSQKILDIAHTPRLVSAADSSEKMCRLAGLLSRLTADTPALPREDDWFEHACRMLEGNINEPLEIEWVSTGVGMSYHNFRKRFTERAGEPPARFRARARVEVARRMLERDELTARAVAKSLGFADEAHFSRSFRMFYGQSLREFRRDMRAKQKAATELALESDEE
ncbi:AraC family transcriptional regulator [bacterium]|nr:MAG: AraC family transcriptional regulator [bacterium]